MVSRRYFLEQSSAGFGAAAFAALHREAQAADVSSSGRTVLPEDAALQTTHHPAAARHVIFCFMSGGVSHIDTFDPKPELRRLHGQPMPVMIERTQFNNNGSVMASPFEFTPSGESGLPISGIFPNLQTVADELAVIRSMTTPVNEHAQGNFFMHTGFPTMGYPSAGAWCAYGLGTENANLPGYVVLQSGTAVPPHGGVSLFSNGFLPARHQGSILQADKPEAIRNIRPADSADVQQHRLNLARSFNNRFLKAASNDPQVEAAIKNYETAFRMQSAVPELTDLSSEPEWVFDMYGPNSRTPGTYAANCILARRLAERGVRFVQLFHRGWDQHRDLPNQLRGQCRDTDQPSAALIMDLEQRGLLDDTLVVWGG
ncbi:MAG: DUF1501 domain-containing protein, partial [Planctomycetaceae bacterium]|nr:DUF1501 domain-containing protein [Planctomycetaceae bacterium]